MKKEKVDVNVRFLSAERLPPNRTMEVALRAAGLSGRGAAGPGPIPRAKKELAGLVRTTRRLADGRVTIRDTLVFREV